MSLEIREVTTKKDYKRFVQLPFTLYKDSPYWVPPIKSEELQSLQAEHNPLVKQCSVKFWTVFKGEECVGRIGAIVHHKYIDKIGKKIGRFTRAEFINNNEVVDLLFETATKWLKEQGMVEVQGPLGFSNLDHQGMLIEGFDHLPSIGSEYHLPYYQEHMDRMGFTKEMDWVEFRLAIEGMVLPEKALRVMELVKKRNGFEVLHFDNNKDLIAYGQKIFEILNEAFKDLFSVVTLDQEASDYYIKKYLTFLNPRFVKIMVDKDKEVVGFTIGLPSLSEAMQKANGKLFPFGFYHMMKAMKNPKVCDVLLTGLHPKYQASGAIAPLFGELQNEMVKQGVEFIETTGMLETNHKAISNWKNYPHEQHKRKRCYRKDIV
ncbi:hypothetical protein K5X82_08520 [Halosquirtibacter xylanolyticus]|uniref:hypothetical protein n=1 Tax=Halosquirtibacter xylanolyticus TaxID=3374599 RepID=UPI003749961F|nr:hypothetical protein K5X82_08520 [Prolixibacteraceae bacterium]